MFEIIKKNIGGGSLRAKFIRSSAWLSAGNIFEKILAFASKIILARLLIPGDLGVVVLITSIASLFECMTEVGVKQCIIQNKNGDSPEFLNAAWWFSVLRGSVLFSIAWMLTPWICDFYFQDKGEILSSYNIQTLHQMVRLAFFNLLFNGLVSPRTYVLERQFQFSRVVGYMQSSALVGILVTIILSFVLRNAWAMVIGSVCQGFFRVLMSYAFCPFLPRMSCHRQSLAQLARYGWGTWGAPFFAYVAFNIDIMVGAKVLGPELIGLYGFVVGLAYIPRELFARIINPVILPTFVRRQDELVKLRVMIRKMICGIVLISMPLIICSFFFHRQIVVTIYGVSFESVSIVFAIFTINVFLIILSMIFINLFMAIGTPHTYRNHTFIRAIILSLFIVPIAQNFGVIGMAILQVFSNIILVLSLWYVAYKSTAYNSLIHR